MRFMHPRLLGPWLVRFLDPRFLRPRLARFLHPLAWSVLDSPGDTLVAAAPWPLASVGIVVLT